MNKIKLFDSFAGIGALHKALTNLNIPTELVGVSEVDKDAILSYGAIHNIDITNIETPSKEEMITYLENKNIGYDFKKKKHSIKRMSEDKINLLYKYAVAMNNFGDISLIDPYDLPDFDLFNFSFPCTNISVAGKQQGMKDEKGNITSSGLYIYGINIIKAKKPKHIMIENVKNLIGKKFINDFYDIVNELEEIGYNCYYPKNDKDKPKCLNAKDFGIPQNRERIFVICIRKDIDNEKFEFPIGKDYGIRLKDMLEDKVDEKYYLSDEYMNRFLESLNSEKMQGGNRQPKILEESHRILEIGKLNPNRHSSAQNSVLDSDGICPTIDTMGGGNREPKVLQENKLIQSYILSGGKWDKINESCRRVYDEEGISPTIHTCQGGNTEPKVIQKIVCEQRSDEGLRFFKGDYCGTLRTIDAGGDKRVIETTNKIKIPQATKKGYIEMSVPGVCDLSYPNSKTRRGRVQDDGQICPTLTAASQDIVNIEYNFRIRKLIPLECWRLMGFSDEDFYKAKALGISDSQLYKQAGNSIVVNVLEAIFRNLFMIN